MQEQTSWKEKLADKIPAELGREIDIFEQQMELRKQGKIDEKVFAEKEVQLARAEHSVFATVIHRMDHHEQIRRKSIALLGRVFLDLR